jgi:LPXTG-motif cell wall-anchored protein
MYRFRLTVITLVACTVAVFALAQNADPNTAGPTKNDYRLRVIQPLEGASIVGDRIQVVVDTEIPAERDTRQDVNSMPRPDIDVFVDNVLQGTMRGTDNVINVEKVAPGPHTLVLLAKNRSGEIIDRKVVHISAIAPETVERPAAPPAPAYVPPPAQAPAPAPQVAAPAPAPAPVEAEPALPKTGTSDPLLAAAGLVLLVGGLAVRRFA